jgi:hypothetical protein
VWQQLLVAFFALWLGRFSLRQGRQHQLGRMGQESRDHTEHSSAETELLLRSGPKLP